MSEGTWTSWVPGTPELLISRLRPVSPTTSLTWGARMVQVVARMVQVVARMVQVVARTMQVVAKTVQVVARVARPNLQVVRNLVMAESMEPWHHLARA